MTEQTNSVVRDAAFYNSHPRSKALRELCLEAMIALNRADHASLHRLMDTFAEYGIEDNMYIGKDEPYFRDPVKVTEFCASQLLKFIRAALQNYSDVASPLEGKAIEQEGIKILAGLLYLSDEALKAKFGEQAILFHTFILQYLKLSFGKLAQSPI